MIRKEKLDVWFGSKAVPSPDRQDVTKVRLAAKQFAEALLEQVPEGADQSHAIRHVRDAMIAGVQGIACK